MLEKTTGEKTAAWPGVAGDRRSGPAHSLGAELSKTAGTENRADAGASSLRKKWAGELVTRLKR